MAVILLAVSCLKHLCLSLHLHLIHVRFSGRIAGTSLKQHHFCGLLIVYLLSVPHFPTLSFLQTNLRLIPFYSHAPSAQFSWGLWRQSSKRTVSGIHEWLLLTYLLQPFTHILVFYYLYLRMFFRISLVEERGTDNGETPFLYCSWLFLSDGYYLRTATFLLTHIAVFPSFAFSRFQFRWGSWEEPLQRPQFCGCPLKCCYLARLYLLPHKSSSSIPFLVCSSSSPQLNFEVLAFVTASKVCRVPFVYSLFHFYH